MTQPLLPDNSSNREQSRVGGSIMAPLPPDIADLRIFWGPEICRLEYLVHLLDTGRVKPDGASPV